MFKKTKILLILSVFILCTSCDILIQNKCDHEYEVVSLVEATCKNEGKKVEVCSLCEDEKETKLSKLPHEFDEWQTIIEETETNDGLQQRKCLNCDYIEDKIIVSTSYVNLDVIKEEFNESTNYQIKSYEDLSLKFDVAILNRASKLNSTLDFKYDSLNDLLSKLVDDCSIPFSFQVSASLRGSNLTLTFTYPNEPSKTTTTIAYTQYGSLNYNPITKVRDDNYNDFKINNSLYSYNVSTTDQLYYVLEKGALPICKTGSNAEKIYNKIKEVLRQIIKDDMTDIEKVKAIHDYLVMNVTYDNDLLVLLSNGETNLKEYNGFYLDGVFLDNEAVCEGISKSFTAMCNIEGIPCVTVEGYQTKNPNGVGHAWNKVYVNNNWYIVDVTSDGTIINSQFEVLSYEFFLIDEATYSKNYTGTTFNNIVCNDIIDIYELSIYEGFDLKIDSQSELNKLVAYFNSINNNNYTLEFEFNFDTNTSSIDKIKEAYKANNISSAYITKTTFLCDRFKLSN